MLIGREKEREVLTKALRSNRPELIAVTGRRRVGKTFLVRTVFAEHLRFETSGVQNAPLKEQLENFRKQLQKSFGEIGPTTRLRLGKRLFSR